MTNPIQNAMLTFVAQNPQASNEEIAAAIRQMVPGAKTSAASVSSMKSRLKSNSALPAAAVQDPAVMTGWSMSAVPDHDPNETLEEAKARIAVRYRALERMATRVAARKIPSLIVSGPPGLGKSYTITRELQAAFSGGPEKAADEVQYEEGVDLNGQLNYDIISGSITAVGLYQALWYTRNGGILVLDDCDAVFRDEESLNILKAVLDSKPTRRVSWRKEAKWLEDYGIDDRFDFKGCVVFLTNIDFETIIQSGRKDAEHFKALIDRSMYLCLTLRARRDFIIRIRQVAVDEGMLANDFGLSEEQIEELMDFVVDNQQRFYNLSLRLVGQIALCMTANPEGWREDIEATKMKTL